MGLGIPKDIIIVFIIAALYSYGKSNLLAGFGFFMIYLFARIIWKWLTNK